LSLPFLSFFLSLPFLSLLLPRPLLLPDFLERPRDTELSLELLL